MNSDFHVEQSVPGSKRFELWHLAHPIVAVINQTISIIDSDIAGKRVSRKEVIHICNETADEFVIPYVEIYDAVKKFSEGGHDSKKMTCSECMAENVPWTISRLCSDCASELLQKCSNCGTVESRRGEYSPYFGEINGVIGQHGLCPNCTINYLTRCGQQGCGLFLLKLGDKCDKCGHYFCTTHKINHTHINASVFAGNHEYIPHRGFDNRPHVGNIESALYIKSGKLIGVEVEAVDGIPSRALKGLDAHIGIAHDGSLKGSYPIELQTPPASSSELERLIENAVTCLRKGNYRVNKTCGMHIHIDSEDFRTNGPKLFKVLSTYYAVEPIMLAMLPKSRRKNRYALPLRAWIDEIKMMELANIPQVGIERLETEWYKSGRQNFIDQCKGAKYDSSRYHGVNLHSLFAYGHIEIRHHHGTLNARKIRNWINLNLLIIDWALNNYNRNIVEAIYFAPDVISKLRIVIKKFGIDKTLRRYIIRNIKKFKDIEEDVD